MSAPAAALLLARAAQLVGAAGLAGFVAFLYLGPFTGLDLRLSEAPALLLNASLCLAFFLQHSVMIRRSFRERVRRFVPERSFGAVFSIASGIGLLLIVVLWQRTGAEILVLEGAARGVARGVFGLAGIGMALAIWTLRSFDTFGVEPLLRREGEPDPATPEVTVRGPYRWVRHPMYTLFLVCFWAGPDLTSDRLLLNVSFTLWTWLGTVLEERDLVHRFGDPYREYQRRVPMLLPWRGPVRMRGH